jgi:hypothetical protein
MADGVPSHLDQSQKPKPKPKPQDPTEGVNSGVQEAIDSIDGDDGFQASGKQPGLAGYYEYQPTYWDLRPSHISAYNPVQYEKSTRQDVWVDGGYYMLDDEQRGLVRNATYSLFGYEASDINFDSVLSRALNVSAASASSDKPVTVEEALRGMIDPEKLANLGGGGGGGGGRTIVAPDPTQIRRIMDATSMSMVGRTLSDKEFNKYYDQYKKQYLSAEGNIDTQQILTERVRKEEDYQEASVANKFASAMSAVLKGSL